jgi:hypothetical protein
VIGEFIADRHPDSPGSARNIHQIHSCDFRFLSRVFCEAGNHQGLSTRFAILKTAIVLRSVQSAPPFSPSDTANARSMLQPGLWPVLQIERQPRLCFVLRMLLGYATSSCAQMLAIEEQAVKALLQNALLQLQHAMTA